MVSHGIDEHLVVAGVVYATLPAWTSSTPTTTVVSRTFVVNGVNVLVQRNVADAVVTVHSTLQRMLRMSGKVVAVAADGRVDKLRFNGHLANTRSTWTGVDVDKLKRWSWMTNAEYADVQAVLADHGRLALAVYAAVVGL